MMRTRRRREQFRVLQPGEVDAEIDTAQLVRSPIPAWDSRTQAHCAFLYERYVGTGKREFIPSSAFCDLPRWIFLEYLIRFSDIRLVGSNRADLAFLPSAILSQNVSSWNQPRHYAFANSSEPIFRAILDSSRLNSLGYPTKSVMRRRFPDNEAQASWGFYFGIDYRALPHAPWRPGTIYLYRRSDFASNYEASPFLASQPIRALARLRVHPWDWPLLDRVSGVDIAAQIERQEETYSGYPWTPDRTIHPKQGELPLVEETRAYMDTYYADAIDLTLLGRRIGVSPFALLRLFQAHVGLSPREYQTQLRIIQAKRLLREGSPIAQVAREVGFCDQTHLTRRFQQIVSMTPGCYLRAQESPLPVLRDG